MNKLEGIKVINSPVYQCRDCGKVFLTVHGVRNHRARYCKGPLMYVADFGINPLEGI